MKWEYQTAQVTHDWDTDSKKWWKSGKCDLSEWLDGWGEDGWELAAVWPMSTAQGMEYWAVFKRPVVDVADMEISPIEDESP